MEDEARAKLNQMPKAQLVQMVLDQGHSELDARNAELEAENGVLQAVAEELRKELAGKPQAKDGNPEKQFVQIATGQPIGAGLCLFALDADGQIWGTIFGRKPWTLLPADGLLEFPS